MKYLYIVLFTFIVVACSDPSPLKSDIEVTINECFGTNFGLVDQVSIHSNDEVLTVMNPREFINFLVDSEKVNGKETKGDITIILKTSKGNQQFSKEQSVENLSYHDNLLCNDQNCYKMGGVFSDYMNSIK